MLLPSLLLAASVVVGVLATPTTLAPRQALVGNQDGIHDGYYYNYWTDGTAAVEFHLGSAGGYSATWSGDGDWMGGKGWQPGTLTRYISVDFPQKGMDVRLIENTSRTGSSVTPLFLRPLVMHGFFSMDGNCFQPTPSGHGPDRQYTN
jgi:hypothetical protein